MVKKDRYACIIHIFQTSNLSTEFAILFCVCVGVCVLFIERNTWSTTKLLCTTPFTIGRHVPMHCPSLEDSHSQCDAVNSDTHIVREGLIYNGVKQKYCVHRDM